MSKIHVRVPGIAQGLVAVVGLAALPAVALAGPDWVEHGDAGSGYTSAQAANGLLGQLTSISGSLNSGFDGPDYEDCYLVRISDPVTFKFQITNAGFAIQLWLFNITLAGQAYGLLANQEGPFENSAILLPASTDGTGVVIDTPGDYMLAITGRGNVPLSRTGAIFNFTAPQEISGADGPGGLNPLTGWSGPGQTGGYSIELTGAAPPNIPAPGSIAMAIAGAGMIVSRRRR